MDIKELMGWVETATNILTVAATPAGIAVAVSVMAMQVARLLAPRFLRRETDNPGLRKREVWVLSWFMTAFIFYPLACWALHVPWRGANAGIGILAGAGGPVLVSVARKFGLDIDEFVGPGNPPVTPAT